MFPAASFIIMLLSFLISPPTGEMIVSLRWDGIAMIAVMTLALAGLKKEKVMDGLVKAADTFSHTGSLLAFFTIIAFILAPFITSPFAVVSILSIAYSMLREREREDLTASFAALITLAATAGGMIFPSGSYYNMVLHKVLGNESFLKTLLPYFIASIPVIAVSVPLLLGKRLTERTYITEERTENNGNKGMRMLYVCFVFIAFLTSFSLFKWVDIIIFTVAILLVFDRKVFLKADYSILLSALFLLIAGECAAPLVTEIFEEGTMWKAVVLTEITGGLPTSSLLTSSEIDQSILLRSVNIGSFGTIISLPALAAFSAIGKNHRKAFALQYTIISVLALAVFIIICMLGF